MIDIDALQKIIETLAHEKDRVLVAIDGRCASGKTTLCRMLEERLDCTAVHVDDFFLQPHQRTKERLEEAGGNFDRERFALEVLAPMRKGEEFIYRPFDCSRLVISEGIKIKPKKICIIEGSYSCHPEIQGYYDYKIFLDVDSNEQMKRIIARDPLYSEMFRNRWIPMEERYFEIFGIRKSCDTILSNQITVCD